MGSFTMHVADIKKMIANHKFQASTCIEISHTNFITNFLDISSFAFLLGDDQNIIDVDS